MKKEKRLAKELRLLGYNYKDIADLLGVSKQSISNWVNGENRISPIMVKKLSEYGISKDALANPTELV